MPYELIYTSAEKGLRPGTRGFCTVACTDGITPNMVMQLEQLSAYRHLITPTSPDNPEVHSHLIIPINGLTWHILSRIADAGLDYTRRSNKIAHHLILSENEVRQLGPVGPVEILERNDLFFRSWDQPPQALPFKDLPNCQPVQPAICQQWTEVYGDSGWGGVLAGSFERKLPVCIGFDPRQKRLPLLREALALLPEERRWNVSFCTYYTKYPPSINCQCKCVLSGSSEEAAVRAVPYTVFLDLSRPGGPVPELDSSMQTWVDFARTGKSERKEPAFTPERPSLPNDRFDSVFYNDDQNFNPEEIDELKDSSRILPSMKLRSQSNTQDSDFWNEQSGGRSSYGFSPDSLQNLKPEPIHEEFVPKRTSETSRFQINRKKKQNLRNKFYIFGSIILILILGIVFAAAWKLKDGSPKTEKGPSTEITRIGKQNRSDDPDSDLTKNSKTKLKEEPEELSTPQDPDLPAGKEKKSPVQKENSDSPKAIKQKSGKEIDSTRNPAPVKTEDSEKKSNSVKTPDSGKKSNPVPQSNPVQKQASQKDVPRNNEKKPDTTKGSPPANTKTQEVPKWMNEAKKVLAPVKKFSLTFPEMVSNSSGNPVEILNEKEMENINKFLQENKLTLKIKWKPLFKYKNGGKITTEFLLKEEVKEEKTKDKNKTKEIIWTVYRHDTEKIDNRDQDRIFIVISFQKKGTYSLKAQNLPPDIYILCLSNIEWYLVDEANRSTKIIQTQWLKPSQDNFGGVVLSGHSQTAGNQRTGNKSQNNLRSSGLSDLFKKMNGEHELLIPMKEKETWELHSTMRILKKNGENDSDFQSTVEKNLAESKIHYESTYLQSGSGDRFILAGEEPGEDDQKPQK
ncbi:MAG: hypothetical protein Q4G69_03740 [Planctomycetia bacterium]|nr:hypothetical protein [Planctomycetia bacterium]